MLIVVHLDLLYCVLQTKPIFTLRTVSMWTEVLYRRIWSALRGEQLWWRSEQGRQGESGGNLVMWWVSCALLFPVCVQCRLLFASAGDIQWKRSLYDTTSFFPACALAAFSTHQMIPKHFTAVCHRTQCQPLPRLPCRDISSLLCLIIVLSLLDSFKFILLFGANTHYVAQVGLFEVHILI